MAEDEGKGGSGETLKGLSPEARGELQDYVKHMFLEQSVSTLEAVLPLITKTVTSEVVSLFHKEFGYSEAVAQTVTRLAERTGDTKEDVLLKAMALYEAALDADDRGQRLVLLSQEYKFLKEITGFSSEVHQKASTSEAVTK